MELSRRHIQHKLEKVFERHGALEVVPPLLLPKTDLYDKNKQIVTFMDPDGNVVQVGRLYKSSRSSHCQLFNLNNPHYSYHTI